MLKRKSFWMLVLSAGCVLRLGIECWPEPDLTLNLLGSLITGT
jgi:hypothetical protein